MNATPTKSSPNLTVPTTLNRPAATNLSSLRSQILTPVLKLTSLIVLFTAIATFPLNWQTGNWALFILESASFVWLLISAFVLGIPYTMRANGFLVILFAFGVYASVAAHPAIDGKIILMGLLIAATTFRGSRVGWAVTILNVVAVILLGWISIANQTIFYADEYSTLLYPWIFNSLIFTLMAIVITAILNRYTKVIEGEIKAQGENQIRYLKQIDELDISLKKMSRDFIKSEETFDSSGQFIREFATVELPDATFQKIVQLIRDQFGYYFVGGYVVDEKKEYAMLQAAACAESDSALQRNSRVKLSEPSILSHTFSHKEIRLSTDVFEDTNFRSPTLLPGTKSELVLPLMFNNEVIAMIDIQIGQYAAFTPQELKMLKAYADQAAILIQKSRLEQQLQSARTELENSYQLYTHMSWQSRLKQSKQKVAVRFRQGHVEKEVSQPSETFQAINEGKPVVITNKTTPVTGKATSSVAIPIKLRNQVIGALHLTIEASQLPEELLSLVETISDRLAIALENARLLEEIQTRADREHLVSEISTKIRSSPNVEQVLRTAVSEIGQKLGVSEVKIHLLSEQ